MKVVDKLKVIPSSAAGLASLLATCLIGVVDYSLPPEVFTSLFYVLPIMLAGWTGVRWLGVSMAVLSGLFWLLTDIATGHQYSHPAILLWNTFVRFTTFLIVALLTAAFRKALDKEEQLAATDGLTGAGNHRFFWEKLSGEYERSVRYGTVFTLACLDIDHFKQVNDVLGHQAGDQLLYSVVDCLRQNLRRTDLVGRLGGDEFALLLPETAAAEGRQALAHAVLALQAMVGQRGWQVSFSIGVVTFLRMPANVGQVMEIADELLYKVKREGKNNTAFLVWGQDAGGSQSVA